MALVTLRNDFHNSEANVHLGKVSSSNAARIRRKLCGIEGCTCGQSALHTRGSQRQEDGRRVGIGENADGTVDLWVE